MPADASLDSTLAGLPNCTSWASRGKLSRISAPQAPELTTASFISIYKEIGAGQRVALAKLAVDQLEQSGRPLRLAIDISIWQFQIQAAKGSFAQKRSLTPMPSAHTGIRGVQSSRPHALLPLAPSSHPLHPSHLCV